MAHGLNSVMKRGVASASCKGDGKNVGSRRIFAPHFKLQVLDSYRSDADCKGNQRATARKYGIHRRQIQKWLQVENTLRHSVIGAKGKEKARGECCDGGAESDLTLNGRSRQRDDEVAAAFEARVPALASSSCPPPAPLPLALPLDFSTRRPAPAAVSPPLPRLSSAPIDLSFKRPTSIVSSAPVRYAPPTPPLASPPAEPHPDVWDLSTKNNNSSDSEKSTTSTTTWNSSKRKCSDLDSPKPVKLFKPYLDDLKDENEPEPAATELMTKLESTYCCSATQTPPCDGFCYDNVCDDAISAKTVWSVESDVKSEYSSSYTLHELQPESSLNYYYYHPLPYAPADYDCNSNCCYEDHLGYGGPPLIPIKQRQSYSLDFKLRAIDCYYQDSVCKGNQRAVASKYNIHRRQVQKWLKQAEELRLRNETMKQIHAVS